MHAVSLHAPLQIQTDGHDKLGIVRNLDNLFLQPADQHVLVLGLVDGPMLGHDVFVTMEFLP